MRRSPGGAAAGPRYLAALNRSPYIPPWLVSLPAQLAATVALGEPEYYRARRDEVRAEREVMRARLIDVLEAPHGVKVLSGRANFFLLELPEIRRRAALVDGRRGRSGAYPAVWHGVGAHRGALPRRE